MLWRTLLTTTSTSHVVREGESVEDESGEDKQAFKGIPLFSQGKWNQVFYKAENGVLVSLVNKGTGVSMEMKRSSQAQVHWRTQSPSLKAQKTLLLDDEPWPKLHPGALLSTRVSLSISGTSKPYSSKSLSLFASQVVFPCFILNHIPHLAQQLTLDERRVFALEELLFWAHCLMVSWNNPNKQTSKQLPLCLTENASI